MSSSSEALIRIDLSCDHVRYDVMQISSTSFSLCEKAALCFQYILKSIPYEKLLLFYYFCIIYIVMHYTIASQRIYSPLTNSQKFQKRLQFK